MPEITTEKNNLNKGSRDEWEEKSIFALGLRDAVYTACSSGAGT